MSWLERFFAVEGPEGLRSISAAVPFFFLVGSLPMLAPGAWPPMLAATGVYAVSASWLLLREGLPPTPAPAATTDSRATRARDAGRALAERIRALETSSPATDRMAADIQRRLDRHTADLFEARSALAALAGAGTSDGERARLEGVARSLDGQVREQLQVLARLYASLVRAELGEEATAELEEVAGRLVALGELGAGR